MDDSMLAEGLRSGSRAGFATLVERHAREAFSFLARVCGAHAAEDLTQRAFRAAWRGSRSFHHDRPMRCWVLGHAVRAAAEHEGFDGRWAAATSAALPPARPATDAAPDARAVEQAVHELPFALRVALVLKSYHDLGIPEICATLDTSGDVVQALLSAASHSFVKRLSGRASA